MEEDLPSWEAKNHLGNQNHPESPKSSGESKLSEKFKIIGGIKIILGVQKYPWIPKLYFIFGLFVWEELLALFQKFGPIFEANH